jgi:hypothetical protein
MSNALKLLAAAPFFSVVGGDLVIKGLLKSSGGIFQAVTALADADATLSAAATLDGLVTITPTVARTLTTPTAVLIVAALTGYEIGSSYTFSVLNTAAFDVTLAPGVGVTIIGGDKINACTATWRVLITSATTVSMYAVATRFDPTNVVLKNAASLLTAPSRASYSNAQTITATGNFTFNPLTNGQIQLITLTNAAVITMAAPTNIVEGAMYKIILKAGDTAARSLAWNSAYKFPGAAAAVTSLSITTNALDVITFTGGPTNTLIFEGSNTDVR